MPMCFVIQPFDGGPFDKRYDDTLEPAIRAAGIEPYRVDRDESSVIPIASIERGIRNSDICLADISTDNPNVWFEVGFAISSGKAIVLVCSHERQKFPFDVQHRMIVRYKTDAKRDFETLATEVTRRLKAGIQQNSELADITQMSPIANSEGLSSHEMVALVIVAEGLDGPVSSWSLGKAMDRAGYTEIAAALAVRSLVKKQYIEPKTGYDERNNQDFPAFGATEAGFRCLENNQSKLTMRRGKAHVAPDYEEAMPKTEEEIPF